MSHPSPNGSQVRANVDSIPAALVEGKGLPEELIESVGRMVRVEKRKVGVVIEEDLKVYISRQVGGRCWNSEINRFFFSFFFSTRWCRHSAG